jgi:hypothetical protein
MSKPNPDKSEDKSENKSENRSENKSSTDEVAQATRDRELRDLIERVEAEKSGNVRPSNESPHDFVERRIREKFKK